MKIKCLHGFFILEESTPGDASRFYSRFNTELVPWREKFTFKALESPPQHCIGGQTYLGAAVENTFAGEPWEIFEANGLVFNLLTGLVVPKDSISVAFNLSLAGNYFVSPGLIQPGSLKPDGSKVISYAGHFSFETLRFRYSSVSYD